MVPGSNRQLEVALNMNKVKAEKEALAEEKKKVLACTMEKV